MRSHNELALAPVSASHVPTVPDRPDRDLLVQTIVGGMQVGAYLPTLPVRPRIPHGAAWDSPFFLNCTGVSGNTGSETVLLFTTVQLWSSVKLPGSQQHRPCRLP